MRKKILVLMSTYNGEKYICQQLESIISQKNVDLTVLVRDDGSTDKTVEKLKEYKERSSFDFIIEEGENIGCKESFFWLIKEAAKSYIDYDYYAFADQDDVWMSDKMETGVRSLEKETNPVKIYYCDPLIVDEGLHPLNKKVIKSKNTLEESFILQPCIGCAMIFSPAVLQFAAKADSSKINIHDAWIYKVGLCLGGAILKDTTPHILYRQHGHNTIGSAQTLKSKWKRRLRWFWDAKCHRSAQAKELINCCGDNIPSREKNILTLISSYQKSIIKKEKIILDKRFRSFYKGHNIMFIIAILFNRI